MVELIRQALQQSMSVTRGPNMAFFGTVIKTLLGHAGEILKLVTPDERRKDILSEITNGQILRLVKIVYEVNFKHLEKQLQDLLSPIKPAMQV